MEGIHFENFLLLNRELLISLENFGDGKSDEVFWIMMCASAQIMSDYLSFCKGHRNTSEFSKDQQYSAEFITAAKR